jgi:hypothetical protein
MSNERFPDFALRMADSMGDLYGLAQCGRHARNRCFCYFRAYAAVGGANSNDLKRQLRAQKDRIFY